MRVLLRSQCTRYCILTLCTGRRFRYFLRIQVSIMRRLCPLQSFSDSFHGRKRGHVFHMDSRDLNVPSKEVMVAFVHTIVSNQSVVMERGSVEQLVVLLDYMGCKDKRIWNLVARSIRFDAFEHTFVDTLMTIAYWCDDRLIANLAAFSDHPMPLHLFTDGGQEPFVQNSFLHHALLCIAIEKNPCGISNHVLESKPVELDTAFPGWQLGTLMHHTQVTGAIAGGAVCGLLAGFTTSDIDIFLWDMTEKRLEDFVEALVMLHPKVQCQKHERYLVFILPSSPLPLQVIPMKQPYSGAGLVHFFDLDPCCCFIPWGQDGDTNIYMHPRAQWALQTRSMDLRNAHRYPKPPRVAKYESRGFTPKIKPSSIFVRLQECKASEYFYNDASDYYYRDCKLKMINSWFEIDLSYAANPKLLNKLSWTRQVEDSEDIKTIYKPWCRRPHHSVNPPSHPNASPMVLLCTTKFGCYSMGYQIVFGNLE